MCGVVAEFVHAVRHEAASVEDLLGLVVAVIIFWGVFLSHWSENEANFGVGWQNDSLQIFQILRIIICDQCVTVIIPVYNGAPFIRRALNSALRQDYSNLHIIIINDGSTDNTSDVIRSYLSDARIQYISLPRNRGTLYVRALAISLSKHYVIFLDADDEIYDGIISKAVNRIEETGADVVWFTSVREENGIIKMHFQCSLSCSSSELNQLVKAKQLGEQLSNNCIIQSRKKVIEDAVREKRPLMVLWGKLFRSHILKNAVRKLNVLVANRVTLSEDLLIMCAVLNENVTFSFLAEVGYKYVYMNTSVSHLYNPDYERLTKRALMNYFSCSHSIIFGNQIQIFDRSEQNICSLISWVEFPSIWTQSDISCKQQFYFTRMWSKCNCNQRVSDTIFRGNVLGNEEQRWIFQCYEEGKQDWDVFRWQKTGGKADENGEIQDRIYEIEKNERREMKDENLEGDGSSDEKKKEVLVFLAPNSDNSYVYMQIRRKIEEIVASYSVSVLVLRQEESRLCNIIKGNRFIQNTKCIDRSELPSQIPKMFNANVALLSGINEEMCSIFLNLYQIEYKVL